MNLDANTLVQSAIPILTAIGLKLLGAIVIWIVGRWLIRLVQSLASRAMTLQHLDATIISYVLVSLGAILNMALVVALLGFFGVETTTFAALLAAAGIAIGAAWSGLLSNFAAGVFLVILRPFKVGDFVTIAGVTGTISAIGLFGTEVDTPDNVHTILGNAKVLGDTIQNYSRNPFRRVDLVAQLDHSVNPVEAIELLKNKLTAIPNVVATPAPDVEILQFTPAGPQLVVRPYCNNLHYWQVYFDTNQTIYKAFSGAGYPVPQQHVTMKSMAAAAGA